MCLGPVTGMPCFEAPKPSLTFRAAFFARHIPWALGALWALCDRAIFWSMLGPAAEGRAAAWKVWLRITPALVRRISSSRLEAMQRLVCAP